MKSKLKEEISNVNFFWWFLFITVGLTISSCYSPIEGCLDPEASNYEISGDSPCDDCCKYPIANMSIFHFNGEDNLSLGDTIINDLGAKVIILKYVYLLSDFTFFDSNNTKYEVIDSVLVSLPEGQKWVKDDVIRGVRNTFTYPIGSLVAEGELMEVCFRIGLLPLLNEGTFVNAINNHPLTTDPDSLYQEEDNYYVFQRIMVIQGDDLRDTVVYDVKGEATNTICVPISVNSIKGKNKALEIVADYSAWFTGIDFEAMSKSEIEDNIKSNSVNIFRGR